MTVPDSSKSLEAAILAPVGEGFRFGQRVQGLREQIARTALPGLDKVGNQTSPEPVEALLVTHLENTHYLTGFTGSNALVVVSSDRAVFVTDGRYGVQSAAEVPGFERVVLSPGTDMGEATAEITRRLGLKTIGYEKAHLTVAAFEALRKNFPETTTLVGKINLVETLRRIKDADEIMAMRAAVVVADACFEFIRLTARVGMTERELAWRMEVFMRQAQGAERLSFDSIVGSGPNSALIHGRPTDRTIGESGGPEFLLCDFGAQLGGYCSDLTRTFVLGGPPTEPMRTLYEAVRASQQLALDAIRPGVLGKDVDAVARESLTRAGFGESFAHGLGHGLGRVVHDGPALSQKSDVVLEAGMILTVEPGAYLEGFGGVRIEDDVLVTESGCEVLTKSDKELLVI
ncbi:MAG: aminopeptidase P family protein [Cytophagales bacterium]|nr:aminopeptidase P family protein [Armatimonadota bacterium]